MPFEPNYSPTDSDRSVNRGSFYGPGTVRAAAWACQLLAGVLFVACHPTEGDSGATGQGENTSVRAAIDAADLKYQSAFGRDLSVDEEMIREVKRSLTQVLERSDATAEEVRSAWKLLLRAACSGDPAEFRELVEGDAARFSQYLEPDDIASAVAHLKASGKTAQLKQLLDAYEAALPASRAQDINSLRTIAGQPR